MALDGAFGTANGVGDSTDVVALVVVGDVVDVELGLGAADVDGLVGGGCDGGKSLEPLVRGQRVPVSLAVEPHR